MRLRVPRRRSAPLRGVRHALEPRTASRGSTSAAVVHRDRRTAGSGGRPPSRSRTRCTATAGCSIGEDGRQHWLNHARALAHRDARHRRLPARRARAAARVGRASVLYQVFPDRFARSAAADDARGCPSGRSPPRGTTRSTTCRPARSRAVLRRRPRRRARAPRPPRRPRRQPALPDAGLPGALEPPLRRARRFDHVDPLLGGDEALVRLVEAAHARGIRVIGDLTIEPLGRRARVVPGGATATPRRPSAPSTSGSTRASTQLRLVARRAEPAEVQLERRPSCAAASSTAPTRSSARWLKPPFSLDGWRIDVANMTGRLGDEDLNDEVRPHHPPHDARR